MTSSNVPKYFEKEVEAIRKIIWDNNLTKAHTPYVKGHWKKDVANEPRQRQMSFNLM
jgi:hypothetical protein